MRVISKNEYKVYFKIGRVEMTYIHTNNPDIASKYYDDLKRRMQTKRIRETISDKITVGIKSNTVAKKDYAKVEL